jgi:hypothetical protein
MHLERIRRSLWCGGEFGQAAVLVGAGFSQNAERAKLSARPFPLWADLANHLVERLYPADQSEPSDRASALTQAKSTSGALRLAEEFEAAFGRDALDRLLIDNIVDDHYRPGPVHRLLLELPWSDVFTTNQDTLVERAADEIVDRKYDVVRTMADIPVAMKPRIVKLNGSFPSTRPFIFTEEDFRTYPRRFAGFVNLVQQAMMENVFCLLGFSGDDPNFLYWSGWVRDNLGKSSPQIYFCGILNLNTAKRKLLQDRNVVPVDLTPLFPLERFPDRPRRHALALEWFLRSMQEGCPPKRLHWPQIDQRPILQQSPGLPPILHCNHPQPHPEQVYPNEPEPVQSTAEPGQSLD